VSFMTTPTVGMKLQCISIRAKAHPGERCGNKAAAGSEWCGKHSNAATRVRFAAPAAAPGSVIEHALPPPLTPPKPKPRVCDRKETAPPATEAATAAAATKIRRAWDRWIARRAGPLLRFRAESNNPYDFFSSDPVEEIPLSDFISFVDAGKGYIMDVKSVASLLDHAKKSGETPTNPFNRAPLPPHFLRRLALHGKTALWEGLKPATEEQALALRATDVFRAIEDLGYYTTPEWFMDLSRLQLQQLYIEIADIWFHRAGLSSADRARICPSAGAGAANNRGPIVVPVATSVVMSQRALRPLLLNTCQALVSTAAARADRQLGVMYVLGSLSIVSPEAATAYPWLVDMFSPGATRILGGRLHLVHPAVMTY
jgi:hypothetical protein